MNKQNILRRLLSIAFIVLVLLTVLGTTVWVGMHSWLSAYLFIGVCMGIFLRAYPSAPADQEAMALEDGWSRVV
jgi:hypothetical protein